MLMSVVLPKLFFAMTFKKDCVELFGTDDLYLILNLDKSNFTASIGNPEFVL